MLTLNAADEPQRGHIEIAFGGGQVADPSAWTWTDVTPWLRTDRVQTIPITRTVAAGGNPCITYIYPAPGT